MYVKMRKNVRKDVRKDLKYEDDRKLIVKCEYQFQDESLISGKISNQKLI